MIAHQQSTDFEVLSSGANFVGGEHPTLVETIPYPSTSEGIKMVQEDDGCCSSTAAGQATSSTPQQRSTEREREQHTGSGSTRSITSDGGNVSVGMGTGTGTGGKDTRNQLPPAHRVPLHDAGGGRDVEDSDDDDDDDEESLAAMEAGLSLLQRYNARTSARGVVKHKRNSLVERDDDNDGVEIERGDGAGGCPQATSSKPFKMHLPVQQQKHQQSPQQQPQLVPQRRIIFPTLYGAGTREKMESNASATSRIATSTEQKRNDPSPKKSRSISFDEDPGVVPTECRRERTMAFISTLKSPSFASGKLDAASMPSDDELLDAMEDRYDPTKSKQHRPRQRRNTLGGTPSLPSTTATALTKRVPASTSKSTAILSPVCRTRAPDTTTTFPIPPFRRGGAPASPTKDVASGEIVCQVSKTYKSKASPKRKVSLFHGSSTLPKVQHVSNPRDSLSPRSPPTRNAVSQPLPSILRKTSSLLTSPITPKKTVAGFRQGTVSFEKARPSHGGGENLEIPSLTASADSLRKAPSELERLHKSQDESSTGSASSLRSVASLRRVSSESSMASSHETERKRPTAVTLTADVDGTTVDANGDGTAAVRKKSMTRHASLETSDPKEISFDARVWVVEYEEDEGNNWFTQEELERFKCEAIDRIRRRHAQQQLLPSGTGRVVVPRQTRASGRALFSDPALGISECNEEAENDDVMPSKSQSNPPAQTLAISPFNEKLFHRTMLSEIRNILVVDPHDMFLKLFAKALRSMMSHVVVTVASTAEEALRRIAAAKVVFPQSEGGATHGFDIIIVEERLQLFHRQRRGNAKSGPGLQQAAGDDQNQRNIPVSGSALISQIVAEQKNMVSTITKRPRFSLLIGVSAHLQLDGDRLTRSGADFVWGKPPPHFGTDLKVEILKGILLKRGKACVF